MGVDSDVYGTRRSDILSLEPLPNLNKVFVFVIPEERQQAMARELEGRDRVEGAALKAVVTTNWSNWGHNQARSTNRPKCNHCQKLSHEKEQCFELVGYPLNWVNRRNARQNPRRERVVVKLWSS
uniref:Uncharacterized protein n=1 Tax=Opuntia streptacantha TaxID=393608 RepID=A0A7C9E1T6_OPUST